MRAATADMAMVPGAPGPVGLRCWGDLSLLGPATAGPALPRGRKARAILAWLALNPERPVRRERLAGLLWGDRGEEQARASLRQAIAELRPWIARDPPLLVADREWLAAAPAALTTDLDLLAGMAAARDWAGLTWGLPDPQDDPLAGLDGLDEGFDDWLAGVRPRLRDRLGALVAAAVAGAQADGAREPARALGAWLRAFDSDADVAAVSVGEPGHGLLNGQAVASSQAGPVADAATNALAPVPLDAPASHRPRRWLIAGAGIASAAALVASFAARDPQPAPTEAASIAATTEVDPRVLALHASAVPLVQGRMLADAVVIIDLMEQALAIEPRFAPGWATLAHAQSRLASHERAPDGDHAALLRTAERNARRAVALAPDLAQAHGTLGMVLGQRSPEAREHIHRAAELDPNDPELLFWHSNVLALEGDFEGRLAALARVITLDPGFKLGLLQAARAHWEMGETAKAERIARSATGRPGVAVTDMAREIDWARGDISRVAERALAMRAVAGLGNKSGEILGLALLVTGRKSEARLLLGWPPELWRVASGGVPSPADLVELDRKAAQQADADALLGLALSRALNAGQAASIIAAYDGRTGAVAGVSSDTDAPGSVVRFGPEVAMALRAVGRTGEADAILERAAAFIAAARARGRIPNWLHADAARVHAARGERDLALDELATAVARGWRHMPWAANPDIAEIAAFRSLRGDSRFEASRAVLLDELARERREMAALGV